MSSYQPNNKAGPVWDARVYSEGQFITWANPNGDGFTLTTVCSLLMKIVLAKPNGPSRFDSEMEREKEQGTKRGT